ncbi:hypothetical protein INR49_017185 [Caranx melampygus]|nr:hypothetical protein INR49_017185 [Caranx melampygus]
MMPHILEINITNQCCTYPPLSPTESLIQLLPFTSSSPHPLISLTAGIKQDPLPDPNPRTSLHLSLPPPNVEWSAGFVMLFSGIMVLLGVMGCIKVVKVVEVPPVYPPILMANPPHLPPPTWLLPGTSTYQRNDLKLSCAPLYASSKISHPPITANPCFFFSIFSFFLSLPTMLASFVFFPRHLFPFPETMVKDNIYRKPPIYRQHGTVHFLFNTSLVWSLHDLLHVICRTPPTLCFNINFIHKCKVGH